MKRLAVLFALCMASYGYTLEMPATYVLKSSMNVWDVDAHDLNGDGKLEIAAIVCDEKSYPLKKQVLIYAASADGAYTSEPTVTLTLESTVGACFFAEVDGVAPKELIAADALGATVFKYENGAFQPIATPRFASLLPSSAKEPVFYETGALDLDADGRDEWVVPVPSAFSIRTAERELAMVPCDMSSNLRDGTNLYISHRLPQFVAHDVPGQAHKSLAFLSDEFADFAYGPNWSETTRFKIPLNLEETWDSQAVMKDIDNNGLPDLLVTQTKGTVNVTVLTQVYLATGPYTYSEKPSATYTINGSFASPLLVDVNGDKKLDLVFVKVPYGLKLFANFLLRRKVSVLAEVHLFGETGFKPEPDGSSSLTIDAPEGRERVAYTLGDFTGDGYVDAAFGMGKDKMAIYVGGEGTFIATKPALTLTFPSFGDARTYKLNGNASEDVVLFHPTGKDAKRIEVIVF